MEALASRGSWWQSADNGGRRTRGRVADLAVTIDYRQVLSEIVVRRLGNAQLSTVFPGYAEYQPLGIVRGADLPAAVLDGAVFANFAQAPGGN